MITKLLDYANKLTTNKNPLSIYKKLEVLMYNAGLYEEQIGLLKSIWHNTNDNSILIKISDLYAGIYNNFNIAYEFCDLFFQKTNPCFYEVFMSLLNKKGYSEFKPMFDNTNYNAPIIKLVDKYFAIVYMIVYLNREKKYDDVLKFLPCLSKLDSEIYENMLKISDSDQLVYNWVINCQNHASELLSQNECHNEINELAIKLNPQNEQAYINIINNLVMNNSEKVLETYNKMYARAFSKPEVENLASVYWLISDFYANNGNKYKAIMYQKYAIDSELLDKE